MCNYPYFFWWVIWRLNSMFWVSVSQVVSDRIRNLVPNLSGSKAHDLSIMPLFLHSIMLQWYKHVHGWLRWDLTMLLPILPVTIQWNPDLDPVFWNLRKSTEGSLGDSLIVSDQICCISLFQQAKALICKEEVGQNKQWRDYPWFIVIVRW